MLILSVRCNMYSRKNNLLKTVMCKFFNFSHNIFFVTASYRASCIRNYAVRTKLTATILNFNICSCSSCQFSYGYRFKFVFLHYIAYKTHFLSVRKELFNIVYYFISALCSYYNINLRYFTYGFAVYLCITACRHNNCFRVKSFYFSQKLS